MRGARRPDGGWTFVSNHFLVLLCIAEDPGVRMADVARRLGLTERAVQGIVADLADAGYLRRTRVGRRNHYDVDTSMPLRHLETQHRQLGELLALLKHRTSTARAARLPAGNAVRPKGDRAGA
jgi:predicted transcriptional regulator